MYHLVFSGPRSAESQARNALAFARCEVDPVDPRSPSHGFEAEPGEAFIACEGEDIDAAVAAVAPLQYRLRAHHHPEAELAGSEVVMPLQWPGAQLLASPGPDSQIETC